ncbi:hypothetical protein EVAR_4790_1 [Eumeta japonica]|uniref:Uncharacterized protein n=1 Tax=Eumeta variegata TaxID=151549 RepID=A0A4C1SYZ0_EUMVA|nr:hypothetical protein EVAR_4790_1 [Eumeta japonica]
MWGREYGQMCDWLRNRKRYGYSVIHIRDSFLNKTETFVVTPTAPCEDGRLSTGAERMQRQHRQGCRDGARAGRDTSKFRTGRRPPRNSCHYRALIRGASRHLYSPPSQYKLSSLTAQKARPAPLAGGTSFHAVLSIRVGRLVSICLISDSEEFYRELLIDAK